MTEEKFIHDSQTVLKFIQCYCDNEHTKADKKIDFIPLCYKQRDLNESIHYTLCDRCQETLYYSYIKLQNCPHDEKPSCRKCPKPCYDKKEWKHLAKIMRYSGLKFGILRIKKLFKGFQKSA
ncbi:MAG: nitrous oxide-stimulated promoter family protein [Sulfurimonas sp.]|uniref:nitrous oxide-stimulated promoter family protein n=1 Tax=Sulfurimonas sp. TaxID=2022749 RepID=UPI0025F29945|nr:nitrous oxide-stimulated promoter family protein [Sulfurimonas sp.]MCK9491911.1 nitrous oxide-stimulated promoter family protein [Sulfurimonas sp.]